MYKLQHSFSTRKVLFGRYQHHDHLGFIYTSILSLSSINVLKVVFMNLFYPDVWEKISCTYLSLLPMEYFQCLARDPGWANVYDHLLPVRLIYRWGTPIPGWEPERVEVPVQSDGHLLPVQLIYQLDFSHTWMITWTSKGTYVNPTIYYPSISSIDGISPIPGWKPSRAEVPRQSYGKCLSVISPSQGGICSPLLQVFLESFQTSLWEESWWQHL